MDSYWKSIGFAFPETERDLDSFEKNYSDYAFKGDAGKIDPKEILNSVRKVTNIDYHKRTVLAAEIVYQLQNEYTIGHLKLQKLIYLCQHTLDMSLHTNFLKQAMGPYDPHLMRSLDSQLLKNCWFKFTAGDFPQYKPLSKAGEHREWYYKYYNDQLDGIDQIIDLFRKEKSDFVELVATIFACWSKAKKNSQLINERLIITMVYNWSKYKQKFTEEDITKAVVWMEDKGVIPT